MYKCKQSILAGFLVSLTLATNTSMANEVKNPQTLDDVFMSIANQDSRFAGIYVEEGQLVINTTAEKLSKRDQSDLISLVKDNLSNSVADYLVKPPVFKQVDFAISDLIQWHRDVSSIHHDKDVFFSDVNERKNRVVIGVRKEGDIEAVKAKLDKMGIPRALTVVEYRDVYEPQQTVRSRHRPLTAGLQLHTGSGLCTIGATVEFPNGNEGIISNSHCSPNRGIADGNLYKQPGNGFFGANRIGWEIADPAYDLVHPNCDPGRLCRFSDSMMVELRNSVDNDLGKIARSGSWGSLAISSVDPDYEVTQAAFWSLDGEVLTKIGRTTGKTAGRVADTCATIDVGNGVGGLTDFTMICQFVLSPSAGVGGNVTPISSPGDSGSPVFKLNASPNPNHTATQHGILWGGNGITSVYSSMFFTVLELQGETGAFTLIP